jgi:outer membrane protein OmpA-like peptidoglycan-associated protein
MRAIMMVGLAALGGAVSLAAQHGHSYEFGVFGSYTHYDRAFNLDTKIGGGARLGYLFGDVVEAEVEILFPSEYTVGVSSTKIDPLIGGGSLVFNLLHSERNILYVLGGYSRLDFGTTVPYRFTDDGAHAAIGDRIFLSHNLALRLEARGIYTPSTKSSFGTKATHIVGSVGLAILAPGGSPRAARPAAAPPPPPPPPPPAPALPAPALPTPPLLIQDTDQDGVPDKDDACPNTPLGATVDARGCPLDSDHDGVPDGIDKCPDTPAGATVDATGCPTDSDHDGVPDGIDKCPDTPTGVSVDAAGCAIDSDHDGVPDGIDKCPDTPAGATVDATGCPTDSDHDGVPDGIDKCPDTPAGATVDATGCPTDGDHDGVPDGIDKCPNTPPATAVDAVGCPIAQDSDGDGVPDSLDKCPNTPKGVPVDATGCMILFRPEVTAPARPGAPPRPTLVLRGVNFQTARSVLTLDSHAVLDQVAASLTANPEIRIEIAGYTDNTGPIGLNLRLSQGRAAAVRAYLARKGVAPARMLARGYGSVNPVAPNTTVAGRAQNRRVELHRLP